MKSELQGYSSLLYHNNAFKLVLWKSLVEQKFPT